MFATNRIGFSQIRHIVNPFMKVSKIVEKLGINQLHLSIFQHHKPSINMEYIVIRTLFL